MCEVGERSRGEVPNSHQDADLGLPSVGAPVAGSAESCEVKLVPPLAQGIVWKVCAWCQEILGAEASAPKYDGLISHGCCSPCYGKQLAEMAGWVQ